MRAVDYLTNLPGEKTYGFSKIAKELIEKLGGKENISGAAHCSTRLRLVLNDESKADKEGIEQIEGVKGQFAVAGQYQIILVRVR